MNHNKIDVSQLSFEGLTERYSSWENYIVTCQAKDFYTPIKNVVKVNTTDSIKTVLSALFSYKLKGFPVYDVDNDKYRAFVDVFDIISYVLNVIDKNRKAKDIDVPHDPSQVVLSNEIAELDIPVSEAMNFGQQNFLFMLPEKTLFREILYVAGQGAKKRIWIYNDANNTGAGLITQTKILQLLKEDLTKFPDIANRTIESLGLMENKKVISIGFEKTVADAFHILTTEGVQAIAILTPDGRLENEISTSDVKALSLFGEFFENLHMPIRDYFSQLRQYCSRPHYPPVCKPTDTLLHVIQQLILRRAHHLFIVEDETSADNGPRKGEQLREDGTPFPKPIGVVSTGDVLRALWQFCDQ